MEPRKCVMCPVEYVPVRAAQRYCSVACGMEQNRQKQIAKYGRVPHIDLVCGRCGTPFKGKRSQKYCGAECAKQVVIARSEAKRNAVKQLYAGRYISRPTRSVITLPSMSYVYGWYNPNHPLPFYIGKGMGRRAWEKHYNEHGEMTLGEQLRTSDTSIVIYRDELLDAEAWIIESVLIKVFKDMGAPLTNVLHM